MVIIVIVREAVLIVLLKAMMKSYKVYSFTHIASAIDKGSDNEGGESGDGERHDIFFSQYIHDGNDNVSDSGSNSDGDSDDCGESKWILFISMF